MPGTKTVIKDRRLWKLVLFGIITFGIYAAIYLYRTAKDLDTVCQRQEAEDPERTGVMIAVAPIVLLAVIVYSCVALLFPEGPLKELRIAHIITGLIFAVMSAYVIFWFFQQGNRMKDAAARYGFTVREGGGTYVLWMTAGLLLMFVGPNYGIYLFFSNLNRLCAAYSYQIENGLDENGMTTVRTDGNRRRSRPMPLPGQTPGDGNKTPGPAPHQYMPGPQPAPFQSAPGPAQHQNVPGPQPLPYQTPAGPQQPGPGQQGGVFVYEDSTPTISSVSGTLEGIRGQYAGMKMNINPGDEVVIGRSGQYSQLIIPDMDVSRKHCTIRYSTSENCFYVTDHSSVGSFLNGSIRLEKEVSTRVPMGSKISLGNGNNEFILR